jgi:ketosteroid isomerase-like protein
MASDLESSRVDIARRMIAALSARATATFLSHLDENVVYESPFYQLPAVQGRSAFGDILDIVFTRFSRVHFDVVDAFAAADPDLVVLECRGDSVVAGTGTPYRNHYLFVIRFRKDLVVEWKEFSNPRVYEDSTAGA